jgi:hypothetical protein
MKYKKKIIFSLAAAAAAILLIAGYFAWSAPKTQQGNKSVTIQVVISSKEINQTFHYRTNQAYVSGLLKDEKNDLKTEMQKGQYGEFVTGLLGVKADSKKEYFNIKVDGKDATVGVSQLPLEDGKTYTFTLTAL